MLIQNRFMFAVAAGAVVVIALVAVALLGEHPGQIWAAVVAFIALIALRYLWRCPQCSQPLSAWPKKISQCKHCGAEL